LDFVFSLKVEDTDEDAEFDINIRPSSGSNTKKDVNSKVLDDWNKANSKESSPPSSNSKKGPVKVSLASKDGKKEQQQVGGKPNPAAPVAAGSPTSKGGYELATSTAKDLQENDSAEVGQPALTYM